MGLYRAVSRWITDWLVDEPSSDTFPLCDFERIRYEVRPCDVLLIEGKSKVSEVIKLITQSPWSHSALYVGRIHDIDDPKLRRELTEHYNCSEDEQLLIEGMMGKGTICIPMTSYQNAHIRICRPRGISRRDAQRVIAHMVSSLGRPYDNRQIFDLARFLLPWAVMPRRWRSSLFQFNPGETTRAVCSTLIAEAFSDVSFPILPLIRQESNNGEIELIPRNPRLFTPRDFDYSPYFEIIKYPFIEVVAQGMYDQLPWNQRGYYANSDNEIVQSPAGADNGEK